MYCENCGIELDNNMQVCPLCGWSATGQQHSTETADWRYGMSGNYQKPPLNKKQQKFTWEIISIIIGSGIVAAFIVDFIISRSITWSEYAIAVGCIIFCYMSILVFWNKKLLVEMMCGFLSSSICLLVLDLITNGVSWALSLAIPLLFIVNAITIIYIGIVRSATYKGVNLIAYAFLGAALVCLFTEGIISFYIRGDWHLNWSVIVSACVVPVVIILLFVHFRLRKGQHLRRTFHI